ncbi:MFS transporter [Candidatus Finniella inopinata]|uniref:Lysosomal dipeptide transporter MFSD1 n=1 Tax=Candidatus Finniella inopinata TaxID=1696036 RepID=A0A4Q7DIK4_9PROT|nr:MFS transporter [Candidatus Finniella inopinata]RZI46801.1 MFS transporter [Candidatus Finniella inopinata]
MKSNELQSVSGLHGGSSSCLSEKNSFKAWMILGCAWLFYLYEYILRVSPSVMTANLMGDFNVMAGALGVLVSFYYISYVALQIPCGIIVDSLGPRKVITFSAILCVLGSVLFAYSDTLLMAQMGRFLMGAGSACAYLSCAKVGAEWFDASKFAVITGMTMMMGTFGGMFGSSPLALLVNGYGWRNAMLIAAIVGIGVALTSWLIIRDYPKDIEQETSSPSQAPLLQGIKLVASNPQNWLIGIYGCMMYLPLSAFAELWGVPFLMERYGIDNELASRGSIMVFLGMALGSPLGAWLSNYCQSRKKIMSWAALGSLISFSIVIYVPHIPLNLMFGILFLGGLISGGQILYFAAAKEVSPPHNSGTTIGFTNCLVMTSGPIFQPLLGWILDFTWDGKVSAEGTPIYTLAMYQYSFSSVIAALLFSWIIVQFVRETYGTSYAAD